MESQICLSDLSQSNVYFSDFADTGKKCPIDVDWKYLQCWSEAPINSTSFIPCPPVFFNSYQGYRDIFLCNIFYICDL